MQEIAEVPFFPLLAQNDFMESSSLSMKRFNNYFVIYGYWKLFVDTWLTFFAAIRPEWWLRILWKITSKVIDT